jgi:enolase
VVVPSGASTGSHEAVERRDGGERYAGFGVRAAVAAVCGELANAVVGRSAADQASVDDALVLADGDPALAALGANAVLAVSLGVCLARADGMGVPLWRSLGDSTEPLVPMPMVNIVSGGAHAEGLVDLQDFLAVPLGAGSFEEAIEWVSLVRAAAAERIRAAGGLAGLVADEGGLSARLAGNEAALELVARAIDDCGLGDGRVGIAIDVAATQLLGPDGEVVLSSEGRSATAREWIGELERWCERYPIVSIEDALGEDDWAGWRVATERLRSVQLIGDDLFATHAERLRAGIDQGVANAVLIKPNQAGTVTRANRTLELARAAGYATVVSARSGDTEDSWLADLSIGWEAGQIKVGSVMRSERTAKWNRLLEIERLDGGRFAGAPSSMRVR